MHGTGTLPVPGMGAGRMVMTLCAGFLLADTAYQPRHRSKRRNGLGIGRLPLRRREDPTGAIIGRPPEPRSATGDVWMPSPPGDPHFLDQLAAGQLRGLLEGCALDDLARIIPEIVQVIVHSSANPAATAWNEFQEATWNARALGLGSRRWLESYDRRNLGPYPDEHAVVIKLGRAHDALWVITNGPCAMDSP